MSAAAALVAAFALLLSPAQSSAGTRPHYGGTIRVLVQHKIMSLDPMVESDYAADRDKLGNFIFETLTEIDAQGHTRPRLATSWQADATRRIWQFQLRAAAFHDGVAVTSAVVAASLKTTSPDWKVSTIGRQGLSIETPLPVPHLPEILSLPKYWVIRRQTDGALQGSGPFRLTEWQPGERAVLTANQDHWAGRPFADSIEIVMGNSLREHLIERNLGQDHAVEISLDQARGLESTSQGLQLSRPAELLVIIFRQPDRATSPVTAKKAVDPRLREALALAINRAAISNVLLQRKALPAGGLLPQWLTGYAFLFPVAAYPAQARRLRNETNSGGPISLAYDFSDAGARIVAERIAVDAREAGISVQAYGDAHINTKAGRRASNADAVLLRLPLRSLDPSAALAGMADDLDLDSETTAAVLKAGRPEELFEAERKAREGFLVVPVAHASQALWLNRTVHNWQQLANGGWRTDYLWVESK
ncbi:MAG TPA: ABC transporter substrate-binding protein [Candidatus Saccharimonadales bacterium]|nr:ABC transporter substrate-binding protein [Candidatus Saccharimonadales bacterium]